MQTLKIVIIDTFGKRIMRLVFRPNGAFTYQPRARQRELRERAGALGYVVNWPLSPERATHDMADPTSLFRPFRAPRLTSFRTQGGASLCPGLICCAPSGRKNLSRSTL
jgi:hypothetical protein